VTFSSKNIHETARFLFKIVVGQFVGLEPHTKWTCWPRDRRRGRSTHLSSAFLELVWSTGVRRLVILWSVHNIWEWNTTIVKPKTGNSIVLKDPSGKTKSLFENKNLTGCVFALMFGHNEGHVAIWKLTEIRERVKFSDSWFTSWKKLISIIPPLKSVWSSFQRLSAYSMHYNVVKSKPNQPWHIIACRKKQQQKKWVLPRGGISLIYIFQV